MAFIMASHKMENSAKCGCNYTATKRISKTATITSISKTQRATRFNVWSSRRLIAVIFLMTQLLAIGQVDAMAMRTRQLKKRHSIMNAAVDWENPCGGVFEGNMDDGSPQKKMRSMNLLRKATRDTFQTLNASRDQGIDISDIKMWSTHNRTYKFLPKLRLNSTIALKRWYRSMQTFVASISYLHTTQRKFDEIKLKESPVSTELKSLLYDARTILCEIESTINHTTPYNREKKLTSLSLEAMNKRLKFRTKKQLGDNLYQIDILDLKFVKYYLLDYLHKMWLVLKKNKDTYNFSNLSGSDSSYVNSSSRSVSSNEINASRRRLGAAKKHRPTKRPNPNKPRQRLHKNNNNNSLSAA